MINGVFFPPKDNDRNGLKTTKGDEALHDLNHMVSEKNLADGLFASHRLHG